MSRFILFRRGQRKPVLRVLAALLVLIGWYVLAVSTHYTPTGVLVSAFSKVVLMIYVLWPSKWSTADLLLYDEYQDFDNYHERDTQPPADPRLEDA